MTSVEYLQSLLDGKKLGGHFMMPLVKQFCTENTDFTYDRYCQDYRVLTKSQLEIMDRFPVDVVNVLGYPYREANDVGLSVFFPEDSHPYSQGVLLKTAADIDKLVWPEPHDGPLMNDRIMAVGEFRKARPGTVVMGAVEAPFAQACTFMGIEKAMMTIYDEPQLLVELMDWILDHEIAFALAQIDAGAEIIFIGDSLASQLSSEIYCKYVFESEKKLVDAIQDKGASARFHICGNITRILKTALGTGAHFFDIDSPVDIAEACSLARQVCPGSFVVGNFDPVILLQRSAEGVKAACRDCEMQAQGHDNFILAPGCEVPPQTPLKNYQTLIAFGHKFSD